MSEPQQSGDQMTEPPWRVADFLIVMGHAALDADAAADKLLGCPCSCCQEQANRLAHGHSGAWCTCPGHPEDERCDCSWCAFLAAHPEVFDTGLRRTRPPSSDASSTAPRD